MDPEPTIVEPPDPPEPSPDPSPDASPDLDAIAGDLAAVETALIRLDDGTYWTDEITGAALPDELLADRPTARRNPDPS